MTFRVRVIVVLVGRATCLPDGAGTRGRWRTTTVNKLRALTWIGAADLDRLAAAKLHSMQGVNPRGLTP
jgi:hypothetical protein